MRLVIFDCDGTLIDSQHAIFGSMSQAFGTLGLPAPARADVLGVVGLSLPEALAVLAPGESEAVRRELIDAYKNGFVGVRARPDHREPLYDGISAAVAALASRPDTLLGIATGKSKRGVARLLAQEGWEGHFVTIQTADDHPSKPDPSMILQAMAETGAAAHETLMVGDTTYDMEMARNAGVGAIGVGWGYHEAARLERAGAHAIVTAGARLLDAIERQFAAQCEAAA
ncbi:MAG: HAD-IA family hydrolase [Hyphomicrobiaceae bacterium]